MTIVQQRCVKCSRTVWAYATDEHPQCPVEVCGVRYMLPAELMGEPSAANYANAHHISPAGRCLHGDSLPCVQCEANERWNEAARRLNQLPAEQPLEGGDK